MRIVALVTIAGLCVACSKTESAKAPPPGEGIELIDGGALPHRELRYHLVKGAMAPLELAMDLDLALGPRGGAMPTIVMVMEIRADDVLPDGSAKIRTKIASASARDRKGTPERSAPPAGTAISTDMMTMQANQLTGLELTATLSPLGALSESKIELSGKDLPPSLAAQMNQLSSSLAQVAMALPKQPIGVGAKWRNRKTLRQNNVVMQTLTTVEIVAIEGDKVTFKSASEVSGANQKVDIEGTQVEITKIGGAASASGVLDLGKMVMHGETRAEFHFDMAAKEQTAQMKMEVAMHLKPPVPAEAAPPPSVDPAAKPADPKPATSADHGAHSAP